MRPAGLARRTIRAACAVLTLYAVLLQGFLSSAVPSFGPDGHAICAPSAAPPAGDAERGMPVHGCCPAACTSAIALPPRAEAVRTAPDRPVAVAVWSRDRAAAFARAPARHRSARGPPVLV